MYEKKLVLDTCALLWLASGSKELSKNALDSIEKASVVYVSAISAWEISLKDSRGELSLPLDVMEWFWKVIENHNLTLAPLDIDVLVSANRLPWHHRDPADRFIIATAKREEAAVVTADRRFEKYGLKVLL
jgi:PIN domain nuclease of toxin-antitoxin system